MQSNFTLKIKDCHNYSTSMTRSWEYNFFYTTYTTFVQGQQTLRFYYNNAI